MAIKNDDPGTLKPHTNHSGAPMSEESYKDWQKSFVDIEESIKYMEENDGRKSTAKRR